MDQSAESSNTNEEQKEKKKTSKWSFLTSNAFFRHTPFAGYSFIEAADSLFETVFWYLLLAGFTFLTVYNVGSTFSRYYSQPMKVSVLMANKMEHVGVSNMTLTLRLPMFEFSTQAPLNYDPWQDLDENSEDNQPGLIFLACAFASPKHLDEYLLYMFRYEFQEEWYHLLLDWMEPPKNTLAQYRMGEKRIAYEWFDFHESIYNSLGNFFRDVKYKPASEQMLDDMYDALYEWMMEEQIPFKHAYLMSLSAIKRGIDPRLELFHALCRSGTYFIYMGENSEEIEMQEQILNKRLNPKFASMFGGGSRGFLEAMNASSHEVLQWALAGLNELIRVSTTPETTLYLTDFSYSNVDMLLTSQFKLKIDVKVPPNTAKLSIKIYSMLVGRFESFFDSIMYNLELVDSPNDPYYDPHCADPETTFLKTYLDTVIWDYLYSGFYSSYESSELLIETGLGNTMTLVPLHKYKLNLKPSLYFSSDIQNCLKDTYKECNEKCINEKYLELCNCYPWYLYYLNEQQENVCGEPCADADLMSARCEESCEDLLNHPCSSYNLDIDQQHVLSEKMVQYKNSNKPLYLFTIEAAMRNYPAIMEEYAMPSSLLLSELGGQLDLWMGINVIGFIHLLVYFIKQICYARHPHTKTGHQIRSLFARENIVNPTDEPSGTESRSIEDRILRNESRFIALEQSFQTIKNERSNQFSQLQQQILAIEKLIRSKRN